MVIPCCSSATWSRSDPSGLTRTQVHLHPVLSRLVGGPVNDLATRTLVYAAPPTPNGGMHRDHLSGPYLAADVLARYLRLRQVDVRFHTGTDDHESHVAVKGNAQRWPAGRRQAGKRSHFC
ncbi:MAG: class I tRNA ligase family protein [Candidatus Sericytochromatia bacterium]|nr:class I tRNA ligase family protein [Candidatus Sericytochromatia bacterium]